MNAFVYVYSTMPREWMAREIVTGIAAVAPSRDEALKLWESVWNQRAPFTVKNEAPPRPKRPDDPKPAAPAIEGDTIAATFHKKLIRRFHSDLVGDRTFTADEVLAIVNEAWNARARA
jgi:hypothetical protein